MQIGDESMLGHGLAEADADVGICEARCGVLDIDGVHAYTGQPSDVILVPDVQCLCGYCVMT